MQREASLLYSSPSGWKRLAILVCLGLALATGFVGVARAQALDGALGCAGELLFAPQYGICTTGDVTHIFSNFVCQYEKIVSEIMSQLYCGMQEALLNPLGAMLTLFVSVIGASILIGTTQFTAREMMLVLFKIALVVAFATRAEFMIDILYKGLVGFITGGVDLVMKAATPDAGGSAQGLLEKVDGIINRLFNSVSLESAKDPASAQNDADNHCKDSPIPLFVTFMLSAPPLFALGVTMAFKLLFVFVRAVIGYLFSLTIIMFLVSLAPIFLSLGLFRHTSSFFHKWVEYLMSAALQIVVVFAFIGFVLSMGIEEDFAKLVNISAPFNDNMWAESQRMDNKHVCSFKQNIAQDMSSASGPAVPPSNMWQFPQVLRFIGTEMFKLLLLAMLVEAALNLAPELAKRLGGMPTAPSYGGGGEIHMQGSGAISAMQSGVSSGFASGGSLPGRFGAAFSRGYNGFVAGDKAAGESGIVTTFTRAMLGLRD